MALKSFNTLIKLHKRRVDLLRRELQTLEEQRQQLVALSHALREEYAREMQISSADAKMAGFFGAYSAHVQKRQESIAKETVIVENAIDAKTEAIRAEFAEQKKYEIARTHELKRLAEKERNREQGRFDEIGNQQYMKLQENPV